MADKIQLPNGAFFPVKEGESKEQALSVAKQMYPDAFSAPVAEKPKEDTKGFKAAMSAGATRLGGEFELIKGKLGIKDEAAAQKEYEAAQKRAQERFTPTEEGWTEAPFQKFKETLGGSIPYMAAPAAAGLAALAAPVSAPVAAGLGLLGAGAVSTGQFTGSNLAAQMETGKSLKETSGAAALAAAVPQALIDTAAMALLPGVGKLFSSVGSKLTTEQAKAIASQTLGKAVMDYTAKTGTAMTREGFTETVQQVLERLQAGTSITDADARKEYIDSFIGGAVLGGAVAPAGRYIERSGAKSQAAKADRDERNALAKEAAEQERIAAETEEAQRQTPDYALKLVGDLQKLEQEKLGLQQQIRKVAKNSPTEAEDKAFNKEINEQLRANASARNELAPEVNMLKKSGVYQQALAAEAAAAEEARIAGLSPEEYAAEQASAQAGVGAPTKATPVEGDPFAMVQRVDPVQAYMAERKELADQQMMTPPTVADYASYIMADPLMAMDVVKTQTPMPGLTKTQNKALLGGLSLQLKEYEKSRQAQGMQGTAAGQQRISEVEAEEQAALEAQRAEEERAAAEAQRVQALGGEFAGLQRMKAAPAGISDQFGLFGTEELPPAGSAGIGQMKQKLLGEDVTYTAEEEKPRDLRRVPGAEFKLRGRNEGTAPVTREELADRLNRVLSTYDLSPEAVNLLQRAEKALPQSGADYFALLDEQLARIESGEEGVPRKGQERTTDLQTFQPAPGQQARASTTAPTEAGVRQVERITGAVPGEAASGLKTPIAQPEAEDRRTGVRGAADVTKRVSDTTPSTLRGPSAQPGSVRASTSRNSLTLGNDLEPLLQIAEEAARVDTGQKSLFPEEQEKLGFIKGNRGAFQMFMKSKFVQNLRQQLRRDEEIAKRAQAIPALEKRANGLIAEIEDILQQYAEYRSADAVLKANKDVAKAKRDMAEIRAAASKSTVDRMILAGAIEDLKQARKQVIEQGYNEGGVQELIANIDAVNEQLQDAQADMALLNSALSVLDGQMQSFAAVQKMTALLDKAPSVERIDQAKQEFAAVRAELDVLQKENNELQTRLRKDAADKRRAEEAVKDAERKAQVAAGRLKPSEQALNNLPNYDKATQYPALTEAQLLAREQGGTTPVLSAAETTQINGDPAQVLGGYRSRITDLEKLIRQSQDKSKAALARGMVEPTQNLRDALDKAYKKAKSAAERDVLGPKLDAAEAKLAQAKAELANTQVIWVGMKKQINDLANVMARADWLEGLIAEGKVELEAPAAAKVRAKPTAEEAAATRAAEAKAAAERTTAASTSGEALTRSQARDATKSQKTLFEGKGKPGGAAVEIPLTPAERLADMQRTAAARNKQRAAPDAFEVFEARGTSAPPRAVKAPLQPVPKTPEAVNMRDLTQAVAAKRDTSYALDGLTYKDAAQRMADTSANEKDKAFFERLVEVFEVLPEDRVFGRVYGSSNTMGRITTAYGMFVPIKKGDAIFIKTGLGEAVERHLVMHELAHAASVYAIKANPELDSQITKLREKVEAWAYSDAGEAFMRKNFTPRKVEGFDEFRELYGLTNNKEFIAEAFSSEGFQKVLAEIPSDKPKLSIFSRLVGYLAKALGLSDKAARSSLAEALAITDKLFNQTRNEIYAQETIDRSKAGVSAYAPANALESLAQDITAQPKTLRQKLGNNLALQSEMQAVDMRAGLRDTLKFGDDNLFTQAMYHVRKA
ncbi:hypothetical protein K0U83_17145, partial [bacterium]|nr:hypothetical protein [bacterium]